jgi:hypothetical protein
MTCGYHGGKSNTPPLVVEQSLLPNKVGQLAASADLELLVDVREVRRRRARRHAEPLGDRLVRPRSPAPSIFTSSAPLTRRYCRAFGRARRLGVGLGQVKRGSRVGPGAFDAGYDSLSGFQDAFVQHFGPSPTALGDASVVHVDRITTPSGPMLVGATKSWTSRPRRSRRTSLASSRLSRSPPSPRHRLPASRVGGPGGHPVRSDAKLFRVRPRNRSPVGSEGGRQRERTECAGDHRSVSPRGRSRWKALGIRWWSLEKAAPIRPGALCNVQSDLALAAQLASATHPNRRLRPAKSETAVASASPWKSGHMRSVNTSSA